MPYTKIDILPPPFPPPPPPFSPHPIHSTTTTDYSNTN